MAPAAAIQHAEKQPEDLQPMSEQKTPVTPDPEVVYTDKRRVSCNGGGGALGHPLVWYSLEDGEAECGYCDRTFIYKANGDSAAGH